MPSSLPGFEYDIFISYRQKDDIYDSWVTEFIYNLKRELAATFKEDIFIYAAENNEQERFDDSHLTKRNPVIFIPILSHTYCDPTSHAWKNELLVFKDLADSDAHGLKVRLANGNVTSRIIPICIRDLDPSDKVLFEKATGGSLRPIDFVFKMKGVNRPLRANEDHPHDNQEKTYYRDQINKVANSIRDILMAFRPPEQSHQKSTRVEPSIIPWQKRIDPRVAWISVAVLATMLLSYFLIPIIRSRPSPVNDVVSIAVLPFKPIGNEEGSRYFADGVMEVILSNLTFFPELRVKPGIEVEKYRTSQASLNDIAGALNVRYLVTGSAQKFGDDIRILVQLVDAEKGVNVWSENFVKKFINLFEVQNQISEVVAKSLKAQISSGISDRIKRRPTVSFEAYDFFLRAKSLGRTYQSSHDENDLNEAMRLLTESLKMDPNFGQAYAWLAGLKAIHDLPGSSTQSARDSILMLANKALELDSTIAESYLVLSQVYAHILDDVNALRFTYKALRNSESDSTTSRLLIYRLASIYARIGDEDKALTIYNQLLAHSANPIELLHLKFYPLASAGRLDELVKLSNQIKAIDPADPYADLASTHVATAQLDFQKLEEIWSRWKSQDNKKLEVLDQYILIYAKALQVNGKLQEATLLAKRLQNEISPNDSYLQAQFYLYRGRPETGVQMLTSFELGSYNVALCSINPVFDIIRKDARFLEFLERNKSRLADIRDRVRQFEEKGLLPIPEEIFQDD